MRTRFSILIVEDEPAIAGDLADIITDSGHLVSEVAYDYDDAMLALTSLKLDLVFLDINLSGSKSGLDIGKILKEQYKIPFIFITSYADSNTIREVINLNPLAYLVKPFKEADIVTTLALAVSKVKNQVVNFPSVDQINKRHNASVSKQEYKVLELLAKGHSNAKVAELLFLSNNTIKTHVSKLFSKLDVNSRMQLIQKVVNL